MRARDGAARYETAKRRLDVALCLLALPLALPLVVACSALVRGSGRGPVFFVQERTGRGGRRFPMWKFRTMVPDAVSLKGGLEGQNAMGGPDFKVRDDPRTTGVGRFLRRTSLDELPQLWNVLKGDMSLVGPRPPLPEETTKYERWQRRRLSMRPGVTGLWQVGGRNRIDFEEWMKSDLEYIDKWSIWLDIKILLRTIPAVLFGSGL